MITRLFETTNLTVQSVPQPKPYLISKFCIVLCIFIQRAFLITENEEDDARITAFILQVVSLPVLLVSELISFWVFSRKHCPRAVEIFWILFLNIGFSQLFIELTLLLIPVEQKKHFPTFLQEVFFLNTLMMVFTNSKIIRGGLVLYITGTSAFRLVNFASKMYYISWVLMALIFALSLIFTSRTNKPPAAITQIDLAKQKYSKLDSALEGVALISKNKDIIYMNGLFRGLFEATTDKEALDKLLTLKKFESYPLSTQRTLLQEIKLKNGMGTPLSRDLRSPRELHRSASEYPTSSLEVPKLTSVLNFRNQLSPRPSIFQQRSSISQHRPSLLQGTPSILLRRGSNMGVSSTKNLDGVSNSNVLLPIIRVNNSNVQDEEARPAWSGNESDVRSPLIHLSPEPSFIGKNLSISMFSDRSRPGESFVSNPPGLKDTRATSRPHRRPSDGEASQQEHVVLGIEALEKAAASSHDTVESAIDAVLRSMSRSSEKSQPLVITQQIESIPFPLEVLKGTVTTSSSHPRQESLIITSPLSDKFNIIYKDHHRGTRVLEVSLNPYIYEKKENLCISVRDVSYETKNEEISEILESKDRALRFVSHEFRTPLNCSISLLDVMKKHIPKDICTKYLMPALNSCKMLLNLANDILDHAQIQAKKLKIDISPCKIKKILEEVIEMMELQASAKKIQLKLDWDSRIPQRFYTDPNRLRQIIINLVSNALKYTSRGTITLQGRYDTPTICKFSVIDTGVGISKSNLRSLFQEFGRIQENRHLNPRGVGLGLVISKLLSQELGPDNEGLMVESEEGKGTIFHFMLESKIEAYGDPEDESEERESLNENELNSPPLPIRTTHINWDDLTPKMHSLKLSSQRSSRQNGESKQPSPDTSPVAKPASLPRLVARIKPKDSSIVNMVNMPYSRTVDNLDSIPSSSKKTSSEMIRPRRSKFPSFKNFYRRLQRSHSYEDIRSMNEKITDLEFVHYLKKIQHNCGAPKVLLVDDSMFNLTAIQAMLGNTFGIEAKMAMDGEAAIEEVVKNQKCCPKCKNYKVIFMDVEMPQMNGFETTQILRKKMLEGEISYIPIIGVTGHNPSEKRVQCLLSGMNDMVTKPVSPHILKELIVKWVDP